MLSFVCVTRVFADVCDPNDPSLLEPNLVAQPPSRVHLQKRANHRLLRFDTTIANTGDGPLIVHGQRAADGSGTQVTQEIRRANGTSCTRDVGFFPFDSTGERLRIADFAEYQLRRDDPFTGPIVARTSKSSFCLLDVEQLSGSRRSAEFFQCGDPNGTEGISVGFANVENMMAPGQSIDLDADPEHPVEPGNYFLVIVVNPTGVLLEKADAQANPGVISVSIGSRGPLVPPPRPIRTPSRPPLHTPPGAPTPTPVGPSPAPTTTRQPHPVRPPLVLPPGHEGCGGIRSNLCSPGQFCQFLENRCIIANDIGACTPMDQTCGTEVAPVCGCNGVTYQNDCQRTRGGTSRAHTGPC